MSLRSSSPSGGAVLSSQITGTTTNDNAATGIIGEFISANVAAGAAVPLTTTAAANITSISLTAGDWDVRGDFAFTAGGTTTKTSTAVWISAVSATDPGAPNSGAYYLDTNASSVGASEGAPVGMIRVSIAVTTTVYLSTKCTFAASTLSAYGFIGARRVR